MKISEYKRGFADGTTKQIEITRRLLKEQAQEFEKMIIEFQKKMRTYLINNSKCDCLEMTTKYGDISDVLFWEFISKIEEKKQDENS